jgi:hypothetical protein
MYLRDYLLAGPHVALPDPIAHTSYAAKAMQSLRQVFLNDRLGCCVVSGIAGHTVGVETGNADRLFIPTDAQILANYEAISGYNPNDPSTDQGCNEGDAINWYLQHGFPNGTKPLGAIYVDATNAKLVAQCQWLFENTIFGIELPDSYLENIKDAFIWRSDTPNPCNGHCIVGVDVVNWGGTGDSGLLIATWGLLGLMTFDAIAELAVYANGGELHCLITPDQLARGQNRAPNGFDWAALISDFDSLGGRVPVPGPAPKPAPPTPIPTQYLATLAQAQAILATGWPKK